MEFKMPNHEQAYWGLRAMKTVAVADGALSSAEVQMLEAVQRMHGTTYSLEQLEPITPEELARELVDLQLRHQLVQGLIVMSLIYRKAATSRSRLVTAPI